MNLFCTLLPTGKCLVVVASRAHRFCERREAASSTQNNALPLRVDSPSPASSETMVFMGRKRSISNRIHFSWIHVGCLYSFVASLFLLISLREEAEANKSSYLSCLLGTTAEKPSIIASNSDIVGKIDSKNDINVRSVKKSDFNKYEPVDCRSFVKKVSVDTDPKGLDKVLVRTKTSNPFLISLHKQKHDKVRWDIFLYGRYYERALEDIWARILKSAPPGSHVVDVGGNIGYYSLFSASMGSFEIDAFEPNPTNVLRFCESVGINYWGGQSDREGPHINIWEMGVSNQESSLFFFPDASNPGAGRFVAAKERLAQPGLVKMPVITLDSFAKDRGWFTSKPNIEILKVDVERHEAEVLLGGKKLFQSGMVKNIFTEVGADVDQSVQVKALKVLIEAGYRLAGQGTFRGPKDTSPWPHDDSLAENILKYVNRKEAKNVHPYLNLWWSL